MKKISFLILITFALLMTFACGNKTAKVAENETEYVEDRIKGDLLETGKKLPDISVKTNKGVTFDSSKTTKPILINCWATW